jgi:hypothetical protein
MPFARSAAACMMSTVKFLKPGRPPYPRLRIALACALALSMPAGAALGGQSGDAFQVTVNLLPTGPGSCTTLVGDDGKTLVNCQPAVVTTGGVNPTRPGTTEATLGYRLPDSRVRLVSSAVVEVGEESMQAWGEYSSRMIVAGGVEYLEMTVTW